MTIIDFHVHAGEFTALRDDIQGLLTKRVQAPGVDAREVFSRASKLEEYLRPRGVERACVLAECGPGTNFSIDSEMIVKFCEGSDILVPFGNINPACHDVQAEFERSVAMGVRGFKFYPADHDYDPFQPAMMRVYSQCAERGLPVMFHTGLSAQRDATQKYIRPAEFLRLSEENPDLVLVLAHAGRPLWYEECCEAALDYENLFVDTGLLRAEEVTRCLAYAEDVRHKVLFGSDWPICGDYGAHLDELREGGFSPSTVPEVFADNARRVLAKAVAS